MPLKFRDKTIHHFGFLERDFDFRRVTTKNLNVRWESKSVFVEVTIDSTRSFEVDTYLGQLKVLVQGKEIACHFGEVARYGGLPSNQCGVFQAVSDEGLDEILKGIAWVIKQIGEPFLRNDPQAFSGLAKLRSRECAAYALANELSLVRNQAAKAWKERAYATIIELYKPRLEHLQPSEIKRYEYALKNVK